MSELRTSENKCIWRSGCNPQDAEKCIQAGCCMGLRSNREAAELRTKDERALSLQMALAVGHMDPRFRAACEGVLKLVDEVTAERDQYKQKLTEAEQLAARQGNEIRRLRPARRGDIV